MRKFSFLLQTAFVLFTTAAIAAGSASVWTYHNDNSRTGDNLEETILTPENVNMNTFGKLFTYSVDGDIYAQPLYARVGTRNIVFVATEHNSVYAFDADTNGGPSGGLLWHVNFGPSAATPNPLFGNRYGGFIQIAPEVGITGTPVIDLSTETLFVDSFTQEDTNFVHRLHALNINSGAERPYSPVVVSAEVAGTGAGSSDGVLPFMAEQELQRAALTLASGYLYVPYCGYADSDPYHGWILGYNAANLKLSTNHIFNSTPNSDITDYGPYAGQAGIWMGGGGLGVDATGNLYFGTGNGSFDAYDQSGGTEYGDSYVKLSTAHNELVVTDYFAPYNQAYLGDNDIDLGSGGILLLPDQPGSVPHLMVSAGKPEVLYLINRDLFTADNNHFNANGASDAVQQFILLNGPNYSTPAYFNGTVYLTPSENPTAAFSVSNGLLSLPASSIGTRTFPFPGATASVSANGTNNGIVWQVERANPAVLVADNATNVSEEIYSSDQTGLRDQLPAGTKYAVPTVANGKVFVGGHDALSVFGLLGLTPSNTPPVGNYYGLFYNLNGVAPGQSGFVTVTVGANGHYTARLQAASTLYTFTGQFYGLGIANNSLNVLGQSQLQLQLQYAGNEPGQLIGTVGNETWSAMVVANEALFNARTNPAPFAGKYTLALGGPANGDLAEPQGNGYGSVTIATSGQLSFQGTLADGTKITQSTMLSEGGQWPLYASLYGGGRGEILGWVGFTNGAQSDPSGDLIWIKSPIAGTKSYAGGFAFTPALEGSRFAAGTAKAPLLDFSNGVVILAGAGLPAYSTNYFTVNANQKLIGANHLTVNISAASGQFSGAAPNPLGGRSIPFTGIFLPTENYGAGYFINTGLSGAVYFGPPP